MEKWFQLTESCLADKRMLAVIEVDVLERNSIAITFEFSNGTIMSVESTRKFIALYAVLFVKVNHRSFFMELVNSLIDISLRFVKVVKFLKPCHRSLSIRHCYKVVTHRGFCLVWNRQRTTESQHYQTDHNELHLRCRLHTLSIPRRKSIAYQVGSINNLTKCSECLEFQFLFTVFYLLLYRFSATGFQQQKRHPMWADLFTITIANRSRTVLLLSLFSTRVQTHIHTHVAYRAFDD